MTRKTREIIPIPITCPNCKGKDKNCPVCYGAGRHYKWEYK